jgi:hypothetical protein
MDPVPDVNDMVAVATAVGSHRGPEKAVLYWANLLAPRRAFDTFVQARVASPTCRTGIHLKTTTRHRCAWEGTRS